MSSLLRITRFFPMPVTLFVLVIHTGGNDEPGRKRFRPDQDEVR